MLANEEARVRVIEWIRRRRDAVIVGNRHRRRVRRAQRGADGIAQSHVDGLIAFHIKIVNDGNTEVLRYLVRGKVQPPIVIVVVLWLAVPFEVRKPMKPGLRRHCALNGDGAKP